MNRRQLFRSLIYAPLIAPLAGMLPESMVEEEICFVISCDSEEAVEYIQNVTAQMQSTGEVPTEPLKIPPLNCYGNGKLLSTIDCSDYANLEMGLA